MVTAQQCVGNFDTELSGAYNGNFHTHTSSYHYYQSIVTYLAYFARGFRTVQGAVRCAILKETGKYREAFF